MSVSPASRQTTPVPVIPAERTQKNNSAFDIVNSKIINIAEGVFAAIIIGPGLISAGLLIAAFGQVFDSKKTVEFGLGLIKLGCGFIIAVAAIALAILVVASALTTGFVFTCIYLPTAGAVIGCVAAAAIVSALTAYMVLYSIHRYRMPQAALQLDKTPSPAS